MACYVIVTSRSLAWTLLSLVATLAVLASVLTTKWVVGPERSYPPPSRVIPPLTGTQADDEYNWQGGGYRMYARSLGLFTRCALIEGTEQCGSFLGSGDVPGPWLAALVFLGLGLLVGVLAVLAALVGCCKQACCANKSLFQLTGAAQGVAGLLYIMGLVIFPFGLGAVRVQRICGNEAAPYYMAECHFGWSFYVAILGVAGTFVCAVLSHQAELATSSDRVQDEIGEGKNLICLL